MKRLALVLLALSCKGGDAKLASDAADASAPVPTSSAAVPSLALQALVARPPPPDGTYLADATVVRVQVCHCPFGAKCDCEPDALVVTNDAADSAAWPLRARGLGDLERRFKVGARYRLTVRVDNGEPLVVDALAR